MAQYFPTYIAKKDKRINRKLTKYEWNKILDYIEVLELKMDLCKSLENMKKNMFQIGSNI